MSSYDNDRVSWGRTVKDSWIADRDRKWIAGEFVWTGFDYIGEPTPWNNSNSQSDPNYPKSSYFGIIDTAGLKKMHIIYIKVNGQKNQWYIYYRIGIGRMKKKEKM